MIYIYDIILNFQNNYYEFFEWNPQDKIINISKIPLYRISDRDITILKNNKVIVTDAFINNIKEANKRQKKIICIVSNGKIALALLFNNKCSLIKKSSLIFEEEEEALALSQKLKITNIKYISNIHCPCKNILRIEKEKKDIIISYIKKSNNINALKYIYYNYYKKDSTDINLIKKSLLKDLSKEWNGKQKKIYKIINILMNINT